MNWIQSVKNISKNATKYKPNNMKYYFKVILK